MPATVGVGVGVDIGCGMAAVRTRPTATGVAALDLRMLREAIEAAVPVSKGGWNTAVTGTAAERVAEPETLAGRTSTR